MIPPPAALPVGAARARLAAGLCLLGLATGSAAVAGLGAWGGPTLGVARRAAPLAVRPPAGAGPGAALGTGDRALVRALLPGRAVGGMRALTVAEVVPPIAVPADLTVVAADPDWVELAGLAPLGGRGLDAQDELAAAPVCLLTAPLAALLGGPGAALRLDGAWWTVVGILGGTMDEPAPDVLVPLRAGALRLAPRGADALDEILVAAPEGAMTLAPVVARAMQRTHGTGGWNLLPAGVAPPAPAPASAGLLAALAVVALALGVFAGSCWRPAGRPAQFAAFAAGGAGAAPGALWLPTILRAPSPGAGALLLGLTLGVLATWLAVRVAFRGAPATAAAPGPPDRGA